MRVLVTRPLPEGERTAAALRGLGHEVILAPVLRIEAIANAAIGADPFAGVILTSANGARALAGHPQAGALLTLPVFTVGARTAEAARRAGFADVILAGGDARALVRFVAERRGGSAGRLLYAAGEDRALDVVGMLAVHGIAVKTVVVYRAVAAPQLVPPLLAALPQVEAVLHYSRRSAETLLSASRANGLEGTALALRHYCISAAVAEPLAAAGCRVIVATEPTEPALLDCLEAPSGKLPP
jgi:uroporphyrinogen-III synthase